MSHDEQNEKKSIELLAPPIERRLVGRLFVIGGPLGLALAMALSLWISQKRVTHAVIVQAEPQWVVGEPLALRVQVTPEAPQELGPAEVTAVVEQGGQHHELPPPSPVEPGGLAQGRFRVPSLTPGAATLVLSIEARPFPPRVERIPIEVVTSRSPIAARHVVSSSMSQYADDSDPQPEAVKIDVRPRGRVLAGFDNELLVRVTDPKGAPWSGPIAVRLLDGELADRKGSADDPPLLWEGRTDAAGLALVHGLLGSEVLRLLVQIRAEDDASGDGNGVLHERKIRLVSFAGAVQLTVEPLRVAPGEPTEVLALGLSAKRPVFVDVYGPDGAWADTVEPIAGREPARAWTAPEGLSGLLQLEAYHFTNAPGESTAVARLLVEAEGSPLATGLTRQRERLSVSRSDRTWDEARERGYLGALEQAAATLPPAARALAQRWVVDTLPVEVHGPPLLLGTRERDLQALLEEKHAWIVGLRIFVFGGGGLYLVAMTVLMLRSHARDAAATLRELQRTAQGQERAELELEVRQAQRAAMARGLLVIVSMAAVLVGAVLLLEILVWEL